MYRLCIWLEMGKCHEKVSHATHTYMCVTHICACHTHICALIPLYVWYESMSHAHARTHAHNHTHIQTHRWGSRAEVLPAWSVQVKSSGSRTSKTWPFMRTYMPWLIHIFFFGFWCAATWHASGLIQTRHDSCIWVMPHSNVTWLIHRRACAHQRHHSSCAPTSHDSSTCDMIKEVAIDAHVWAISPLTSIISDITHSYVSQLIHIDMMHTSEPTDHNENRPSQSSAHTWHASFIRDMPHSYVTCLIHNRRTERKEK